MNGHYNKPPHDLGLIGLSSDNLAEYYEWHINRWKFDHSDEVFIDGQLIDEAEKRMIKLSRYDIRPKPESISVSCKANGSDLTETRFIEYEISRIEKLDKLSLPKRYGRDDYLVFLQQKKESLNKDYARLVKELKDNGFIAGATAEVLKSIIENHSLPGSSERVQWTGTRVAAWYFKEHFKIGEYSHKTKHHTPGIFNKCFVMKDANPLHGKDRPKNTDPSEPLKTILDGFR